MANLLVDLFRRVVKALAPAPAPSPASVPRRAPAPGSSVPRHLPKPTGGRRLEYSPKPDGDADPGEIVWTWVPYEEDASQGKDRPVLVVGRDGDEVFGLMLSSQSERDGQRNWLALGPGDWDRENRPSWVRLDRVLAMKDDSIRREGAVLDGLRFAKIAAVLKKSYGWN